MARQKPRVLGPIELAEGYPPELRGDGRRKVAPVHSPPGAAPMALTRAQCRAAIDRFRASGMRSQHSPQGATVWVILYYCWWAELPYSLTCWPGMGYTVQVLDKETDV